MKFVFISRDGDIIPLAQRIEQEGHDVIFFISQSQDTIPDKHVTNHAPDVVVIDSPGFGDLSKRLKANGFNVIGGSPLTDKLADDHLYNQSIINMFGVKTTSIDGIGIQIEGWFNGKEFGNILYNIDSIVTVGSKNDKLFKDGLSKITEALKKSWYNGPVSLSVQVTADSSSYKNLRACFTVNTLLAIKEGLKGRVAEPIYNISSGQNKAYTFKPGWYTYVELVINPNRMLNNDFYDEDLLGISEDNLKHMWLYGITKKGKKYVGRGGRVAVVTARGDTVKEARRRAYRTVHNLVIPNLLFLNKVGDKAAVKYSQIKSWGWIQ